MSNCLVNRNWRRYFICRCVSFYSHSLAHREYVHSVAVFQKCLTSDLLSIIISNTDKHEFSSIWKWIKCCNDVMSNADCVIKCDVYLQKIHSCSKYIHGISVFVLKISVVYYEKRIKVLLHGYPAS